MGAKFSKVDDFKMILIPQKNYRNSHQCLRVLKLQIRAGKIIFTNFTLRPTVYTLPSIQRLDRPI